MGAYFDITEFLKRKHGRITIIKELDPKIEHIKRSDGSHVSHKLRRCLCKCDCGKLWEVSLQYLKNGQIKSCGCYREDLKRQRKKHGMALRSGISSEYKIWASMIQRCKNAKEKCYKHYGGRGITVCDDWLLFENFYRDMGNRPSLIHTLERINVNGNYEPSNCKWATREEQLNNKRTSRKYRFGDQNLTVKEWAKQSGINMRTLKNRLKNPNWTIEKALLVPTRKSYERRSIH
jgi:hypothetical protein